MSEKISDKPWSTFERSDYTLEQWHRACLIHLHTGEPEAKEQCKLPVREPDGTLNRNGIHAAAAVLAGTRGGKEETRIYLIRVSSFHYSTWMTAS